MITLKLNPYSKVQKVNLYRLFSASLRKLKKAHKCNEKDCANCCNRQLCKDLTNAIKFLQKEISPN